MGQISTFGSLTQLNFNFAQVTSLNKTFGNFSFDGYYYEEMSLIATATLTATPTFLNAIVLYEIINMKEGNFERVADRAIGFLFGGKPINIQTQLSLLSSFSTKITVQSTFDAQIIKQLGLIGKIRKQATMNAQINNSVDLNSKIISNKNSWGV